jgi:hypothetical protein
MRIEMLHPVGLADLLTIPQPKRTEQSALGRASPIVVRIRQCLARFADAVSRILRGRRFPAFGPGAV